MPFPLNVVVISGSIRQGRQTHKLAVYLYEQIGRRASIEAHLVDLAQTPLPILDKMPDVYVQTHNGVKEMSQLLYNADAIVWVSPEYHGSFSGVLKNALDFFWHEFSRKPVGVATATNGKFGGINASVQMQQLALSMGSYAMPYKLIVPHIDRVFDSKNRPIEPTLIKETELFIDELLWLSEAVARQKAMVK